MDLGNHLIMMQYFQTDWLYAKEIPLTFLWSYLELINNKNVRNMTLSDPNKECLQRNYLCKSESDK